MTTTALRTRPSTSARVRTSVAHGAPALLALGALIVIVAIIASIQPEVLSTAGITLMLTSAVPLVAAAQAQVILMSVGDIDLGLGNLVGLVTVIAATSLTTSPGAGFLLLAVIVGIYALVGWAIQRLGAPSIIVTLGLSFVWFGVGVQLLPSPGGAAPGWLTSIGAWDPGWIPAPLVFIVLVTLLGWYLTRSSRIGARIRALGSNDALLDKFGHSRSGARVLAYVLASVLIIVAGLLLASQTQSGDINSAGDFTLTSIAAVILGGGNFSGGRALPIGATLGAITLGLITVLLSLVNLSSNLQSAAQGLAVLIVLSGRAVMERLMKGAT